MSFSAMLLASVLLASLGVTVDAGSPVGLRCPVGGDGGVVSVAWSTLPDAKQLIVMSPSLRVLWVAYPGDPPTPPPEVTCLDGGLAVNCTLWLPFQLGFEERGERLSVDLRPAREVLDLAFKRPPGSALTDATALVRAAQHTVYRLRSLDPQATTLQVDARDLELRERAWGSSAELASALQFLSQTPRGRAIAADVEERLVLRAPFVMRDLHQLDVHEGATPPLIFWQGTEPCVSWAGPSRCTRWTDASLSSATFTVTSTRGLERGDSLRNGTTVRLVHAPPSTLEGEHDEATATLVDVDRRWSPAQLIISTRGRNRFSFAPDNLVLAPSRSAGVVLTPRYAFVRCKPGSSGLTRRRSCDATFRVESYEVWAFSTGR